MKYRIIRIVCLLLCVSLLSGIFVGCGTHKKQEDVIDIMVVWPGLSGANPENQTSNAVADVIKEETGLTVKVEFSEVDPTQRLTSIFATGKNMPSVIMCPYYGTNSGESRQLKMAAQDGLLLAWDDNISEDSVLNQSFTLGLSQDFIDRGLGAEEFAGKKYILPMHTAASIEDETNWGYTVYCRKDILADLKVDPTSINSSEDVYELAKKIKAGNYKDINGNDVIPASCWQNGWAYEVFLNSYRPRQFTSILEDENGNLQWLGMNDVIVEEAKFMNKMIKEGLFDQESFTQSDATALSKYLSGSVALTGAHYTGIQGQLEYTLYASHPEMRYVPLGPILDMNGKARMPETYRMDGVSGGPCMVMTKDCAYPEQVVKYLEFINSEIGKRLVYFGIEGTDWEMVDGEIRMTQQYFDGIDRNGDYGIDRGIGAIYTYGVAGVPNLAIEKAFLRSDNEEYQYREQVREMYPLELVEGTIATAWDLDFPRYDELTEIMLTNDYATIIEAAYFADSATEINVAINRYRQAINQGGIMDEYLAYVKQKVAEARAQGITVLF